MNNLTDYLVSAFKGFLIMAILALITIGVFKLVWLFLA